MKIRMTLATRQLVQRIGIYSFIFFSGTFLQIFPTLAAKKKVDALKYQIEARIKSKADLDQQQSRIQARMQEIESEIANSKQQINSSKRAFFNYLKMKQEMMKSSLSLKVLLNSTPAQMDRKLKWVQILEQSEKEKIEVLIAAKISLQKLSKELAERNLQLTVNAVENEKQTQRLNEQIRLQAKILEKTGQDKNVLTKRGKLMWPAQGNISQNFGLTYDDTLKLNLLYQGIQISSNESQVIAAAKGTVRFAEAVAGLGNTVIIDHGNSVMTAYALLGNLKVSPGKFIEQGESLGQTIIPVGETSAKVYFEIRHYGMPVNPNDWLMPKIESIRTNE
jgi:septal ring factor EnvC (AmiA/AmiB activator)